MEKQLKQELTDFINGRYESARIWEFDVTLTYVYVRFTVGSYLRMLVYHKPTEIIEIFEWKGVDKQ